MLAAAKVSSRSPESIDPWVRYRPEGQGGPERRHPEARARGPRLTRPPRCACQLRASPAVPRGRVACYRCMSGRRTALTRVRQRVSSQGNCRHRGGLDGRPSSWSRVRCVALSAYRHYGVPYSATGSPSLLPTVADPGQATTAELPVTPTGTADRDAPTRPQPAPAVVTPRPPLEEADTSQYVVDRLTPIRQPGPAAPEPVQVVPTSPMSPAPAGRSRRMR